MTQLSLSVRSVLLALLALTVFIPATVFTLDAAYTSSLTQAKYNQLKLMGMSLISAFELEDDEPYMPEQLYDDQLNLPESGYIGLVVYDSKVIWQSASSLPHQILAYPAPPVVGEEYFSNQYNAVFDQSSRYFLYAYTAEFEHSSGYVPVHFYLLNDRSAFMSERDAFTQKAWQWLLLLALALVLVLLVGFRLVLRPVHTLIAEINQTSAGKQQQLQQPTPRELTPLKHSINELLRSEAEQRNRYKHSLDDLAHSLKTPLAAALGTANLPNEATTSLRQIDNLIQRQLKRATAGTAGRHSAVKVSGVVESLFNALSKVYRDKSLQFELIPQHNLAFVGDKTDLMEILGNLLDNACKAAHTKIKVTLSVTEHWQQIVIEDDGPGFPDQALTDALNRGTRLDTYADGQGIGLAVVSDLVTAYAGQLNVSNHSSGGARIVLQFPVQKPTSV